MPVLSDLHLMRPEWLWGLLPGLLLIVLLWRQRGRRGSWNEIIAPDLLPFLIGDQQGTRAPNLLPAILIAWVLACLAAAGPSWQKLPQPVIQKQDALVLVLDLSLSMKAADLQPSRMDRARQKLLDLLAARREGQTGLIAFAGDAHVVTPLTDDNPTIANLLPALHPDMMPLAGSDAAGAITLAKGLLHSAGVRNGRILLVTDGVAESQHREIADTLSGTGIEMSILAVGTDAGAPIPLPRGGFLKDKSGTIVIPRLDAASLQQLSSMVGGRYRSLQIDDSDLDYLLKEITLPRDSETLTLDRTADAWEDQGYWLVLLLLPIVLAMFRRGWLLTLMPFLLFIGQPQPAQAQTWDNLWLTPDQQGQRALQAGDTEQAAQLFENRDWAGTAAYRGEDYEAAVEHFSEPSDTDDWYNRGNALARVGNIDDAIAAYKESLAMDPGRTDAEENLALLEQLKDQQQQQQQDNEQQDQDQDQQQDQQDQQDPSAEDQQQPQDQEQQDQQSGDKPQDNQSNPDEQQQDPEAGEQEEQEEEPASPEEQEQSQEQTDEGEQQEVPAQAEPSPEDQERDQAMEQWLRRVPDDPSGLLREKFRYESQQREAEGQRRRDDSDW